MDSTVSFNIMFLYYLMFAACTSFDEFLWNSIINRQRHRKQLGGVGTTFTYVHIVYKIWKEFQEFNCNSCISLHYLLDSLLNSLNEEI